MYAAMKRVQMRSNMVVEQGKLALSACEYGWCPALAGFGQLDERIPHGRWQRPNAASGSHAAYRAPGASD